jgi:hypothetical protein
MNKCYRRSEMCNNRADRMLLSSTLVSVADPTTKRWIQRYVFLYDFNLFSSDKTAALFNTASIFPPACGSSFYTRPTGWLASHFSFCPKLKSSQVNIWYYYFKILLRWCVIKITHGGHLPTFFTVKKRNVSEADFDFNIRCKCMNLFCWIQWMEFVRR